MGAVGLSGQMHGSVLLDKSDRVLRPASVMVRSRTAKRCDQINRKAIGRTKVVELVSNPAVTGFTLPKLLWVREHEPEVVVWVRKFCCRRTMSALNFR